MAYYNDIKIFRKAQKMTQEEFADKARVSARYLRRIEKDGAGGSVSISKIEDLFRVLGKKVTLMISDY